MNAKATKIQAAIINAHFEAKESGKWTATAADTITKEAAIAALKAGKTSEVIFNAVVQHSDISITSALYASGILQVHLTDSYKKAVRKVFVKLLNELGIK